MKLFTSFLPLLLGGFFWVKNSTPNTPTLPTEICDNGIDDDNDGLIDLNDTTDCNCPLVLPLSLIPNPSFEERTCCPQDRSELYCAKDWIQASEPTTDYLHTCGWMGWPDLPPPTPFPDGKGCVGFRNGRTGNTGPNGNDNGNPNWKEYAGACLLAPLKAGTAYRFQFWVGFTKAFNSPPTNIVFYGSPDCDYLPFGIGDETLGCPTNAPGWIELGSVPISGALEWIQKEINVTPTADMYAIAIGPDCSAGLSVTNTYYFFDNLVLADVNQFDFKISELSHPCSNDFALSMPFRDTLQYQWYHDGIALVGETSPTLHGIAGQEGEYQVRILGPNSCKITPAYPYKIPSYTTFVDTVICGDETVSFNQTNIGTAGEYLATLTSHEGCDSLVRLRVKVSADGVDTVFAKIFESETYHLGDAAYTKLGEYDVHFSSYIGCDSVVHLILDFYKIYIPNALSPNGDGFNDVFTIFSGEDVKEVLNLSVYDRWGGRVYELNHLPPNDMQLGWDGTQNGKVVTNGVYTWKANIIFEDGKSRELLGSVTVVK